MPSDRSDANRQGDSAEGTQGQIAIVRFDPDDPYAPQPPAAGGGPTPSQADGAVGRFAVDGEPIRSYTRSFSDGSNDSVTPVCFAEGTRIATLSGPMIVDELAVGDLVVTAWDELRAIRWIGQMHIEPAKHPRPHEANPVLVRAQAFDEDMPVRDLRLSPGHAVYWDGALIPIGHLVNGATIVQESVDAVRYFHIELDGHDVLLAERLPCESYLDDGNRDRFEDALATEFHSRDETKAYAPVMTDGEPPAALQKRLRTRAETLGWRQCEAPALRLMVDHVEIAPRRIAGNRYWFVIPAAVQVTLASNAGVPGETIPGNADRRRLGVAISELRIDGRSVALDDAVFGAGFHAIEHDGERTWRWTDGGGVLACATAAATMIEIAVLMVAPSWQRAVPDLRVVSLA